MGYPVDGLGFLRLRFIDLFYRSYYFREMEWKIFILYYIFLYLNRIYTFRIVSFHFRNQPLDKNLLSGCWHEGVQWFFPLSRWKICLQFFTDWYIGSGKTIVYGWYSIFTEINRQCSLWNNINLLELIWFSVQF